MYYYILDENKIVVNAIVLTDGVDPAVFGAIADDRVFDIGDTWTPPPTMEDRVSALEARPGVQEVWDSMARAYAEGVNSV